MITKEEYSKACKEVLEILKFIKEDDLNKIPDIEIKNLKENASKDYEFTYDPKKKVKEQNISKLAKAIIANFFIDYIATPYQKQIIINKQNYDIKVAEEAKKEKYNEEEIFADKKQHNNESNNLNNLPVELKKTSIITKLIEIIKKIFKLKK